MKIKNTSFYFFHTFGLYKIKNNRKISELALANSNHQSLFAIYRWAISRSKNGKFVIIGRFFAVYGFIQLLKSENGFWLGICLREKSQHKGIARLALKEFLNNLDSSFSSVYLKVLTTNIAAINLYKSLGFEIIREEVSLYQEKTLVLYVMMLDREFK